MYAIRSYYDVGALTGNTILDGAGVSMSATTVTGDVGVTATGDVTLDVGALTGNTILDGAGVSMSATTVITSYSIHYTKLYDVS